MKNYTITVNGNIYDVVVEEKGVAPAPAVSTPAPVPAAPKAAPAVAPAAKPAASGAKGSVLINSPMPGKILAVKVNVGQEVKKGDVVLLLEAMKMENEVVAAEDGKVVSIDVATGDMVEAGDVLASLS